MYSKTCLFFFATYVSVYVTQQKRGRVKSECIAIHHSTCAFFVGSFLRHTCSPTQTWKHPCICEEPDSLIHLIGLVHCEFLWCDTWCLTDFPLNFTVWVGTFSILWTNCPESQRTIVRHFYYQRLQTCIGQFLKHVILAEFLLLFPLDQFFSHPFFSFNGSDDHDDRSALIRGGTVWRTGVWLERVDLVRGLGQYWNAKHEMVWGPVGFGQGTKNLRIQG